MQHINILHTYHHRGPSNVKSGSIFVLLQVGKNVARPHRENACRLFIWSWAQVRVRHRQHLHNWWVKCVCQIFRFAITNKNSKIRNSSHRFLWSLAHQKTSTQSIGSVKHFQRKCRKGQKFDLELKLLWRHCHAIFIPIAQKLIS